MAEKVSLNPEKDYTKEELRNFTLQNLTDLENQTKKNNKKPSLLTLISEVKAEKTWNETISTTKVETQTEIPKVSMDDLKSKVKSESMLKILSLENIPEALKKYKPEPKSLFDLFATQKLLKTAKWSWLELSNFWPLITYWDSIKMIIWKRLVTAFDSSSIWDMATSLAKSQIPISWDWIKVESIKKAFDDLKWFSDDTIKWDNLWKMEVFNFWDNPSTKESDPQVYSDSVDIPKSMIDLSSQIESIVEEDCKNLVKLINLAKDKNKLNDKDFEKVLASPKILDELLEKWTYNWNWFDIDLLTTPNKLDFSDEAKTFDVKSLQDTFIYELALKTDEAWKPVDEAIKSVTEIAKTIKDWTWYDVKDLKGFIDNIEKEHPFLWWILKMFFWMFFWALPTDAVENSKIKEPRKISLENLINFQSDQNSKKYLPEDFKLDKEEDVKKFDTFFNTINSVEESRISTLPENEKVNKSDEIIKWPNFWKDVLIWTDLVKWTMMFKIHEKVKWIIEKVPKPNMQQFIEEINNINPDEIKEDKIEKTKNEPSQTVSEPNMNQTPNPVIPAKTENTNISSAPVLPNSQDKPKEPKPADPKDKKPVEEPKPKTEQTQIETVKIKTLEEQIASWKTDLLINWKTIKVSFDKENKQIMLWKNKYSITIKEANLWDVTSIVNLESISLINFTFSYPDPNLKNPLNKSVWTSKIDVIKSAKMVTDLLSKWNSKLKFPPEQHWDKDITVEINKIA